MVIYLSSLLLLFTIFWSYLFINHLFAIRIPDRGLTQGKELRNGGFYYGLC